MWSGQKIEFPRCSTIFRFLSEYLFILLTKLMKNIVAPLGIPRMGRDSTESRAWDLGPAPLEQALPQVTRRSFGLRDIVCAA
jgi:hypothetical protein